MRLRVKQGTIVLCVFLFIFIAVFFRGGQGQNGIISIFLSVATFLFGVLGVYIMQNRYSRLENITMLLRQTDSLYIGLYRQASAFGKKTQKEVQQLLDTYVTTTIDYCLHDYSKAGQEFLDLYDYINCITPKNTQEFSVFSQLLGNINDINKNRKLIEYLVRNTMILFEWVVLFILWSVIVLSVFLVNDGSLMSMIITILLSSASLTFLFLIKDLDNLVWKEQKWIWEPLKQLFGELDLLPYYPEDVIRLKRVEIKKGVKRRVAYYPHAYPDFSGKKISVETEG